MDIDKVTILRAMRNAAKGHRSKPEVRHMAERQDEYALDIANAVETGSYVSRLRYREFERRNTNGKLRHIESPDLFTRVLQHL